MAERLSEVDLNLQGNTIKNANLDTPSITGLPEKRRFTTPTIAGILAYTLTELPNPNYAIETKINGIGVAFSLVGVNLTITKYSAGDIDAGMTLEVFYFKE